MGPPLDSALIIAIGRDPRFAVSSVAGPDVVAHFSSTVACSSGSCVCVGSVDGTSRRACSAGSRRLLPAYCTASILTCGSRLRCAVPVPTEKPFRINDHGSGAGELSEAAPARCPIVAEHQPGAARPSTAPGRDLVTLPQVCDAGVDLGRVTRVCSVGGNSEQARVNPSAGGVAPAVRRRASWWRLGLLQRLHVDTHVRLGHGVGSRARRPARRRVGLLITTGVRICEATPASAAISCSVVTLCGYGGSFHLRRSQRWQGSVTITDSRKVLPASPAPCAPSCSSVQRGLAVEEGRRPRRGWRSTTSPTMQLDTCSARGGGATPTRHAGAYVTRGELRRSVAHRGRQALRLPSRTVSASSASSRPSAARVLDRDVVGVRRDDGAREVDASQWGCPRAPPCASGGS
jgi:hypothetical protein